MDQPTNQAWLQETGSRSCEGPRGTFDPNCNLIGALISSPATCLHLEKRGLIRLTLPGWACCVSEVPHNTWVHLHVAASCFSLLRLVIAALRVARGFSDHSGTANHDTPNHPCTSA
jgi:hypothetical protein